MGPKALLIAQFVGSVFPAVDKELKRWEKIAENSPEEELLRQAKSSIRLKKFHAQGGSVYALYPGTNKEALTSFIVAYQTISDYLDNLCDRVGTQDEKAFRQLHLAMVEALKPGTPCSDYYRFYPYKTDGGYLKSLVEECQRQIVQLPGLEVVDARLTELAVLYSELQIYKHLPLSIREEKMVRWASRHLQKLPGLSAWEFGAAAGSTLGIFILCAAAADPDISHEEGEKIFHAYFPYVCALHILLDYFIDQKEDEKMGDLNFVSYYADIRECCDRLKYFFLRAREKTKSLPHPHFHHTVLQGLLAMYLTDPKAAQGFERELSKELVTAGGREARILFAICRCLRKLKIL